jgi:hypothetical protein
MSCTWGNQSPATARWAQIGTAAREARPAILKFYTARKKGVFNIKKTDEIHTNA